MEIVSLVLTSKATKNKKRRIRKKKRNENQATMSSKKAQILFQESWHAASKGIRRKRDTKNNNLKKKKRRDEQEVRSRSRSTKEVFSHSNCSLSHVKTKDGRMVVQESYAGGTSYSSHGDAERDGFFLGILTSSSSLSCLVL